MTSLRKNVILYWSSVSRKEASRASSVARRLILSHDPMSSPINAVNVLLIEEPLQATTIQDGENGGEMLMAGVNVLLVARMARTSVAMIDWRPFQGLHRRSPGISFKAGRTEPTADQRDRREAASQDPPLPDSEVTRWVGYTVNAARRRSIWAGAIATLGHRGLGHRGQTDLEFFVE